MMNDLLPNEAGSSDARLCLLLATKVGVGLSRVAYSNYEYNLIFKFKEKIAEDINTRFK